MTHAARPSSLLVVDDDPAMIRLLECKLSNAIDPGLEVEYLSDPAIAAARLEQGGVDILLTDLEMPGINGLELTKLAKQRNAWTQIILLTGNSSLEALLDAMEAGATDYLLKQSPTDELLALVADARKRLARWQSALINTWRQKHAFAATRS